MHPIFWLSVKRSYYVERCNFILLSEYPPRCMRPVPPRWFTILFVTITILEIIGDELAIRFLHYGCKPLIMLSLLAWSWANRQRVGDRVMPVMRLGMLFAWFGDVCLMIREVDLFSLGLAGFLVMQLCYCLAFRRSMKSPSSLPVREALVRMSLPFVVYAGVFLARLYPTFQTNPAFKPLWWPVVAYVACLSAMGLFAALRRTIPYYGYVLTGALLFIASDSAIAVQVFLTPFPGDTFFIMATYATAQYLLVVYTQMASERTQRPSSTAYSIR